MTEFEPLAYAASVVALLLIVGYVAAMQWNPLLRARTREAGWLTGMAALRGVGFLLGALAWTASQLMWLPYLLVLLWSKRAEKALRSRRHWLAQYSKRRAFHRPQHAA